jgi:carboxynorspermidine decarboxylase
MHDKTINTPAFIFDIDNLRNHAAAIKSLCNQADCKLLYPLKTCALTKVLQNIAEFTDGFSASSLFEAKLAKQIARPHNKTHFVSPYIAENEFKEISEISQRITFNSLSQIKKFAVFESQNSYALRINPKHSIIDENKYDPCRRYSKLGVDIDILKNKDTRQLLSDYGINGLHFHTGCECTSFTPLLNTVNKIVREIPELLQQIDWINLGGGYYVLDIEDKSPFIEAAATLKNKFNLELFFEPGSGMVADCSELITTVTDIFTSDNKHIAILDTSVNHLPEVYEYEYKHDLKEETQNGRYIYQLAGATCLSGDIFGDYRFAHKLKIGDTITFKECGAYSLVKANMFNGIRLPDLWQKENGRITLIKQFKFTDYATRFGDLN